MHQHRAHSHRRRIPAAISVAVLTAGLVTTLTAGTAAAQTTELYVNAEGTGTDCTSDAPCQSLQEALTLAATNVDVNAILLQSDLTVQAQVVVSTSGITIDGADHTITAAFKSGGNGQNAVLGVFDSSNVTIQNLTVDGGTANSLLGIHAYLASSLELDGVTIQNSGRAGLLVNGSDVTANGLNTSNNAWGSVDVDSGSGVEEPSKFSIDSTSVLRDKTQIWSDGANTDAGSTVLAPDDYHEYVVKDEVQPNLRIWAKGPLTRPGAWFDNGSGREFYASLQSAVDTVAGSGTVVVAGDITTSKQVTVSTPGITIDGADHIITAAFKSGVNGQNAVLGVFDSSNVTIQNLTVDGGTGNSLLGIHAYLASSLELDGVTIQNSGRAGLLVNGSDVTVTDLTTSGNAWGSVEVDSGSGVEVPSKFSIDSASVLGDQTQIWSDGVNVNSGATTVNATGYDVYHVNDTTDQPLLRIWSKGPLARPGAWFDNGSNREFYASLQSALDTVAGSGTVVVAGDITTSKQVTVSTPGITIDGADHKITASFPSGVNGQNAVLGVFDSTGVTVHNLIVNGAGNNLLGIHAFRAGLELKSVMIQNSGRAGLLVNGSDVTATDLATSGNAWGSVEVDSGVGVAEASTFTVDSSSSLGDQTEIWSDGTTDVHSTVTATGYVEYNVQDNTSQPNLRIWAKGAPVRQGAYYSAKGQLLFYSSLESAIESAAAADASTLNVEPGVYTATQPTAIAKPVNLVVDANRALGNTFKMSHFALSSPSVLTITPNSVAVDVSENYWGSASPDFTGLKELGVNYSPWYIDPAMSMIPSTNQQQQATPAADKPATANITGAQATATGTGGVVTLAALPTTTVGDAVPGTLFTVTPTKVVDLSVSNVASLTQIELKVCDVAGATRLQWWNSKATPPTWQDVSPMTSDGACLTAALNDVDSSPKISELTGTVFAAVKVVSTPGGGAGGGGVGGDSGLTTPPSGSMARIAGSNRYATAALIAGQFVEADSAYTGAVVLANGENFKQGLDALSANYLAGAKHAPILLTQGATLPPATAAGLSAILTDQTGATIYVVGGVDSVSDAVVAQAKKIAKTTTGGTVTVKRLAGSDRYATSAASATSSGAVGTVTISSGNALSTAILASGEVNADALAAGSLSFAAHLPVLLTQAGSLPPSVKGAIAKLGIKQVIVLGGVDRVSVDVVKSLAAIGVTSVTRIAGTDRFDTAARIYGFARSNAGIDMGGSTVYLANGITGFPDALAVGPLAGATGSSVLTVSGTSLPASTQKFITSYKSAVTTVIPLGASLTVAQSVVDAAKALLS